jgi:hypothetical protein
MSGEEPRANTEQPGACCSKPGNLNWLLLRGPILPRWQAYSGIAGCRRTLRVRLARSPLRAPAIIAISALSPRTQLGLPG